MDIQDELYEAAWKGDIERIRSLIAAGANTKSDSSYVLRQAAMNGKTECVEFLIPLTEPKANSSEALLRAAERGHIECLERLIPVSDCSASDSMALRWATERGQTECMRALLPFSDDVRARKILETEAPDSLPLFDAILQDFRLRERHSSKAGKEGLGL